MSAPETVAITGIDEAGLGPLLGPLVIGGATFSAPRTEAGGVPNLWQLLADVVTNEPRGAPRTKIPVVDSKLLHKPAKGVGPLEATVLPFALAGSAAPAHEPRPPGATASDEIATLADWLDATGVRREALGDAPWYEDLTLDLPRQALSERVEIRGRRLRRALAEAGVTYHGTRVLPLVARAFNAALDRTRNKAVAHFEAITTVLGDAWHRHPQLVAVVDRQGGRDFYAEPLARAFPEASLTTLVEGRRIARHTTAGDASDAASDAAKRAAGPRDQGAPESAHDVTLSRYRLTDRRDPARVLDVAFVKEGERFALPVALASCFAKYTRELLLECFNDYWAARVPGLKPTKGYAVDGRRFVTDLERAGVLTNQWRRHVIRER